jgi:hypothetical protein
MSDRFAGWIWYILKWNDIKLYNVEELKVYKKILR